MAIYIRVSPKTREARRYLESIKSSDGKPKGKVLLKNFLNTELSNKLSSKKTPQSIIKYTENSNDSNITEFAKLLLGNEGNQKKFKSAVKSQAHSTGTKKDGLFNKLIYRNENLKFEDLSKSKIKAFLLAKQDSDINEDENEDEDEYIIAEEDKKSRRMKNKDIVEKINSGRLSNVLKAFMALVLWDYLKLKEEQEEIEQKKKEPEKKEPEKKEEERKKKEQEEIERKRKEQEEIERKRKEQEEIERKKKEQEEKEQEEKERIERFEKMAVGIKKICSFNTNGILLTQYETSKIREFRSEFDKYSKDELRNHLMSMLYQNNGFGICNGYEHDIKALSSIFNTPKTANLSKTARETAKISEEDLVHDLRNTYEEDYYEGGNREEKNLKKRTEGFREIVNSVKPQDEDVDLKLDDSFFNQKINTPYRNIKSSEMVKRWGVDIEDDDVIPKNPKILEYKVNNVLHKNIKSFFEKWFPDYRVATDENFADYVLGAENENGEFSGGKLEELLNGKKDSFSLKLFLRIIYSFEKEAKELNVTLGDFCDPPKKDSSDKKTKILKEKLRDIWESTAETFHGIGSNNCCIYFQKIIDKMALLFDIYYAYKNESKEGYSESEDNDLSFSDRRFCQLLRDQATDKAVKSCNASYDGGSGVDYARLFKSVFTPLVNATDSGYHSEPILKSLHETYESLAVKWKSNVSSFDLIREVYNKTISSNTTNGKIEKLKEEPINYNKFILVAKSVNKISKKECSNKMKEIYKVIEEEVSKLRGTGELDVEASELFDKMGKWIKGTGDFSISEFDDLTGNYFYDLEYGKFFKDIFENRNNLSVILYILHLDKVGLMKISE